MALIIGVCAPKSPQGKHGPKQAIVATAHKIARAFYALLKSRQPFKAMSADEYDQRQQAWEVARLKKKADKLGFTLTAAAPAA